MSDMDWSRYVDEHQDEIRRIRERKPKRRGENGATIARRLFSQPYIGMSQREQDLAALWMRSVEPDEETQERALNIARMNAGVSLEKALGFIDSAYTATTHNEVNTMTRQQAKPKTKHGACRKAGVPDDKYPVGAYLDELPANCAVIHESKADRFKRETRESGRWRIYRTYVANERSWRRAQKTVERITGGDGEWAPRGAWEAQVCRPADFPGKYVIPIRWAGGSADE